ncbi:AAA family ATPase [Neomoorella thermoacetica]|uniref:AAA family ATPase n=1 Tax=Neomoorella thermoacetica TaxID=1525 RepID=UPI0008FB111B|nr:AAA family ATPase [Moorella thermoacetica]APC08286.1 DNA repair protein RadA [Moorella thermoacetica]
MNTIAQKVNKSNIPNELKALQQWVVWRYEERDGKPTKPPYDPQTGRHASVSDPNTWASFDEALATCEGGDYDGIGLALTETDDLIGIDLDHCVNPETGEITDQVMEIIEKINSYTEISPSGVGIRIIAKVSNKTSLPEGRKAGNVEFYTSSRYLTLTGNHLQGTPAEICERQAEVGAFVQEYFGGVGIEQTTEELGDTPSNAEIAALLKVADQLIPDCHNLLYGDWPTERQNGLDRSGLEYLLARRLVEAGLCEVRTVAVVLFGSGIHQAKATGRSRAASWKLAWDCAVHALEGGTNPVSTTEVPQHDGTDSRQSFLSRFKKWKEFTAGAGPVDWLWRYLLGRKHVTVLAGDPGTGKSTLLRRLLYEMYQLNSSEFLKLKIRPPRKVLIVTEETPDTWLNNYPGDLEDFDVAFMPADEIADPSDWEKFCIELENCDAELVVIDSFNSIFHGESINDAASVNNVLRPLQKAARHAGFSALVLDHNRKDTKDAGFGKAVMGSYAKVASADFVVSFARANPNNRTDKKRIIRLEKTRSSSPDELLEGLEIELTTEGGYQVNGSRKAIAAEQRREEESAIWNFLYEAGRDGKIWLTPKELSEATGVGGKRLTKHLKKLIQEGIIVDNGKGTRSRAYALKQYVTAQ